jgi:hypothetical protein
MTMMETAAAVLRNLKILSAGRVLAAVGMPRAVGVPVVPVAAADDSLTKCFL